MKGPGKKPVTGFSLAVFVFLGLEAVGIIVLAVWNLIVRSSWKEMYHSFGASPPLPTSLAHSTPGFLVAICIGSIFLCLLRTLVSRRKTKTGLVLSIFALLAILLEILALYLPYWQLAQPLR
jgi:ABC-type phosphate transport system permease subunit